MIDYGSEYDDAQGGEFARAVRALNRELPASDRLAALLRGLAAESSRFALPRQASAAPALRLLAYDGLITDILGEEIVAGQLSGATLESLGRLAAEQEPLS
jgi:hypothetical protein